MNTYMHRFMDGRAVKEEPEVILEPMAKVIFPI